MELHVWVGGLERVVSGVSTMTSCQEVIYALARATGNIGRFVLVEQWRSTERSLAPTDYPLQILHKWGEHARDVLFVLKCLDTNPSSSIANTSAGSVPHFVPESSQGGKFSSCGTLPRQNRNTGDSGTVVSSDSNSRINLSAISVSRSVTDSPLTIRETSASKMSLNRPPAPPSYTESMKRRQMMGNCPSPLPFLHNTSADSFNSQSMDYNLITEQIAQISTQRENVRLKIAQLKNVDRQLQESIGRGQYMQINTQQIQREIQQLQDKIDIFNQQAQELQMCIGALESQENQSQNNDESHEIEEENLQSKENANSQIPGMWV